MNEFFSKRSVSDKTKRKKEKKEIHDIFMGISAQREWQQ